MKIHLFPSFLNQLNAPMTDRGLEIVPWDPSATSSFPIVVLSPMDGLPPVLESRQAPSLVALPHAQWPLSFLEAILPTGAAVMTPQTEVADFFEARQTRVALSPLWWGSMEREAEPATRSCEVALVGKPHPAWLEMVNAKRSFTIDFNPTESADRLGQARVAVLTGESPGYPPWVFEAIRRGTVVVIPDSHKILFPPDIFPTYGTRDLAAVVEELLRNPEQLNEWVGRAFEWFASTCRPARFAEQTRELLAQSPPPVRFDNPVDLAHLYKELGLWEKAAELLDPVARETGPRRGVPIHWNNLGVIRAIQGLPDAENLFRQAGTSTALFNLACLLNQGERFEEALACYRESLERNEPFEGWLYPLTFPADATWDPLTLTPTGTPEWETLLRARHHELAAHLLWKLGRRKEGIDALRQTHQLLPENPRVLFVLGGYYLANQMVAQPIKYWTKLLKLDPFHFEARHQFANIYAQIDMPDQALLLLQQGLKFPESINPYRGAMAAQLGYNLYQVEKLEEAALAFVEALSGDPENRSYRNQLAVVHVKQAIESMRNRRYDDAKEKIAAAFGHEPDLPIAYNVLGSIAYEEDDMDRAKAMFQKALAGDPNLTAARENLEECLAAEKVTASIIVVSHGDQRHAGRTLMMLSQFSDLPHEIIYVHPPEASSTGAKSWEFLREIPLLQPVGADFQGVAEAYAMGLERARGRYVIFMEDDVMVGPDWLSALIRPFSNDPLIGAVGPTTNYCQNPAQIPLEMEMEVEGEGVEVPFLDSFCLAIRRDFLREIGGWDRGFLLKGMEDEDLALRIKISGRRLVALPTVFVSHVGLMPHSRTAYIPDEIDRRNREHFRTKWSRIKAEAPVPT